MTKPATPKTSERATSAVDLPPHIALALQASNCPDREKVATLYNELIGLGRVVDATPMGSKERVRYHHACVRISMRLVATEAWGPSDMLTIEQEIASLTKGA